ncbi:hypothetical protein [Oceanobacillus oncorhynchi]|uniref:hypothetical protein n=1 Tax=Oceanobacillus oncorhynchi TaxID=545501 RepID=UPI0034D62183
MIKRINERLKKYEKWKLGLFGGIIGFLIWFIFISDNGFSSDDAKGFENKDFGEWTEKDEADQMAAMGERIHKEIGSESGMGMHVNDFINQFNNATSENSDITGISERDFYEINQDGFYESEIYPTIYLQIKIDNSSRLEGLSLHVTDASVDNFYVLYGIYLNTLNAVYPDIYTNYGTDNLGIEGELGLWDVAEGTKSYDSINFAGDILEVDSDGYGYIAFYIWNRATYDMLFN